MIISVNTAFSIGSAISDSSPPHYVFQARTPPSGDASTLGGSRASLSSRPRTWADMASGRNSAATEISDSAPEGMDQFTIISDLASSRAAGEEGNMSQSEDNDMNMGDSGIESAPKSLTSSMEVEARKRDNDWR